MKYFRATFNESAKLIEFMRWLISNLGDFSVELQSDSSLQITVTRINLLGGCVLTKTALKYGAVCADADGSPVDEPVFVSDPVLRVLTEAPTAGSKTVAFITLINGCGGWNSCLMEWNDDGFYEPWNTGYNNTSAGDGSYEGAVTEAKHWAMSEELPYYNPYEKEHG